MSTGTTNVRRERSWTQQQERAPNRRVAMVFLGLSAISLFVFFIWLCFFGLLPPQTFVATLSILDYKNDVPKIRLGKWEDKMSDVNGLYPWEEIKVSTSPENNEEDVKSFFTVLERSKKLDIQKDTAIIQLRCHAAVTKQGSEGWSCGLYINDDRTTDKPFPIASFLELAARVPAKNIVVFAEIADLQFEPHLGWVINPIEHYIRKACEDLDWKTIAPDKKVWFVLSNADFQHPLFSVKRGKKTLFQEACEESLREEAFRNRRGDHLTLARYFELIYRHCDKASGGRQTPRLILANKSDEELPIAEDVFISNYKKVISLPNAKDKKQEKNKSDSVEPQEGSPPVKEAQRRNGRQDVLVSFRQNDAKAIQDPKSAKPIATDPRVRFWQIRDEIEDRGGSDKNFWSPRDFAPFAWRKLLADVAKASIWESQETDSTDLARALDVLRDSIAKGQPVPLDANKIGDHWKIVSAWNDFRASDSSFRRQWQNESTGLVDETTGLLGAEIDTWRKQRLEFRSYIDCLAELSSWIDLAAEFASADFSEGLVKELNADCNRLISELLEQKKWIPRSNTESAEDQSKSLQMEKALGIRKSLYEHIEKAIRSSRLENKKEDLTWLGERKYQVLLSSPLLKHEQREQLVKAMKDREREKVVAETDRPLKSIQPRLPLVQLSELETRCEMLRKSWPLLSDKELIPVPKEREKLLAWGSEYYDATMKLDPLKSGEALVDREHPYQSTVVWHYLSLVDPRFALKLQLEAQYDKSWAGIVVAPLDPKTIRLSLTQQALDFPEGKFEVQLPIKVVYFDGTDVPSCDLNWTTKSELKDFSVKYGAKIYGSGQSIPAKPSKKEVVLNCSLRTPDSPESGTQIWVSAMSSTSKKVSNQLAIPVFRNADRIDLVVRSAGESVPLKEKKGNSEKKDSWVDLESPAISGSTSEFRISMSNKKNAVRSVELKVYLAPLVSIPGKADTNLVAIAEFEAELPSMQETPVILKSTETKTIDPKSKTSPLEKFDALNSILIFEIVEYEIPEVKKEGATKKKKGTPLRYTARFKPMHPKNFVKATPGKVEAGSKYSIEFEPAPELWKRHGMQELPVSVRGRTMVNGEFTAEKTLQPPMIITEDNSKAQFLGSVFNTNTQRFLIDIGGYPRALVFEANPSLLEMTREYDDQIQIVGLRPIVKETNQAAGEKPANVAIKKFGEYMVFPWLIDGEQVSYRAIEIDTIIDKAPNSTLFYEILKLEGNEEKKFLDPRTLSWDRSFEGNLRIKEDGNFVLGYVPDELKIRHFEGIEALDGTYVFRVHVGEQLKDQKFIFDKKPPPPSFVDAQGATESKPTNKDNSRKSITLFKGEKVVLQVDTEDTAGEGSFGAGVDKVEFRLCSSPTMTFDESTDPLVGLVTSTQNRVSMKLDSAAFDGRPEANYWITAKTIDRAGNFQIRNQPLRVDWRDAERPAPPK